LVEKNMKKVKKGDKGHKYYGGEQPIVPVNPTTVQNWVLAFTANRG
jgi:hypothetical protein